MRISRSWRPLVIRVALALAIAATLMFAPIFRLTPRWFAFGVVPVVVFLLICYIGKLLYDTLFFDRYNT
ncbi:MAG: hypothetical protein A2Z04_06830 [Chloroflexi bacterium RBG_16_57_9]|nr:MAG: hypothetical protein A2Z04_06830 [Chloroflexi bacterium RBG_16_57_9]